MEPWHGIVDIPEQQIGGYRIRHIKKAPGERVLASNFRTALYMGQSDEHKVFPVETTWHELTHDGGVWMTDYPIEQIQHDKELAEVAGRVLVGGLGIGYAANVLAARPEVTEIVVVEISEEVCNLVAPHLKDPHGKITVVNEDLFDYLKRTREVYERDWRANRTYFDYAFFDIWQSDGEGTFHNTVMPLRKLASGWVDEVICWNEDCMRGQLAQGLKSRVLMLFMAQAGIAPKGNELTLDKLCEEQGDVFWDWCVPFWRAVRDGVIELPLYENGAAFLTGSFMESAGAYAGTYGLEGWERWWRAVCSGAVTLGSQQDEEAA